MSQAISFLGLFCMLFFAWLLSANRWKLQWRPIIGGVLLQFLLAALILKTSGGAWLFLQLGRAFEGATTSVDGACRLVFGPNYLDHQIAFQVLPVIIVFSALTAGLYYVGIMGLLVRLMSWVMLRTLGASGAESMIAAANVFLGHTSAPLVARPFLAKMTDSELMTMMVSGFATIATSVMAAYISMGIDPTLLLTASVIAAPGSLVMAKILQPEVDTPDTLGKVPDDVPTEATNLIHALTIGTTEGLHMALSVGAMILAFVALIAMCDGLLGMLGDQVGLLLQIEFTQRWSLALILGYVFMPFAYLIGVEAKDCYAVGQLLGTRMALNEFLSYAQLAAWRAADSPVQLSPRSEMLATFAMCGFANIGSIGILIGGMAPVMPSREKDLARLGWRAMLGGTLVGFSTACVVGTLFHEPPPKVLKPLPPIVIPGDALDPAATAVPAPTGSAEPTSSAAVEPTAAATAVPAATAVAPTDINPEGTAPAGTQP